MPDDDRREHGAGALVSTFLWWICATVLYLSFVTFTWTQVLAGGAVAAAAVAMSRRGARAAGLTQQGVVPRPWPPRAVAAIVLGEFVAVGRALFDRFARREPVSGRFVAFRIGHEIDPGLDTALTLEASLAPNTYVVAVLPEDEDAVVLLHQFTPEPGARRSFPRWRT